MKVTLENIKEQLISEVEQIKAINISDSLSRIKQIFNVIELMGELDLIYEDEEDIAVTEILNETSNTEVKEDDIKVDYSNGRIFTKKLSGGHIEGFDDVRVSESLIRTIGLESGDLIKVGNEKEPLRNINVLDKNHKDIEEDFVLFKYCPVKVYGEVLYCDEYFDESSKLIKINDEPYIYHIHHIAVENYKLKEGDIIDIGYEKANPNRFIVVWKYDNKVVRKPIASGHYKESKSFEIAKYNIDLKNKNVLVIGLEARKRLYEETIINHNGKFLYATGDEQLERVHSLINKSDVVLILKDHLSHPTVWSLVEHSKSVNKIFKVVDGIGVKKVLDSANELVEKLETA